jgi:hypothetical protein
MFEVSWLSGQMTNVIARIAAKFLIMCPYYAHMCLLGWLTMMKEKNFLFIVPKSHFPFSECQKRVVLRSNHEMKVSHW